MDIIPLSTLIREAHYRAWPNGLCPDVPASYHLPCRPMALGRYFSHHAIIV